MQLITNSNRKRQFLHLQTKNHYSFPFIQLCIGRGFSTRLEIYFSSVLTIPEHFCVYTMHLTYKVVYVRCRIGYSILLNAALLSHNDCLLALEPISITQAFMVLLHNNSAVKYFVCVFRKW